MNGILYDIDEIPAELRSYFEQVEAECGAPWERVIEVASYWPHSVSGGLSQDRRDRTELGWQPACSHAGAETVPCTVLDPFVGSGTTLAVAKQLGRRSVGIELSADYVAMAARRVGEVTLPMAGVAG